MMALALAGRDDVQLHLFHDERAAAFAALGIGLLGTPAVLLCTSGTAAAHFHAAVIEADLSAVPLLVCTADRPPELRDVGAPQTIDQTKLYGSAVRWFHDPGVATQEAAGMWRSLAAHAYASATGAWPGPVHLNLPFREPLVGKAYDLPARSASKVGSGSGFVATTSSAVADAAVLADLSVTFGHARGLIVAGHGSGAPGAVRELALATGWPVLADARSGARHVRDIAVGAADALLRSADFAASHQPDVVIRLGEPPASKVLNQWLAGSGARQLHVTAVPKWTDPDGTIGLRLVADPSVFCRSLATLYAASHSLDDRTWMTGWLRAEATAQSAIDMSLAGGLSEPLVARSVVAGMQDGSHLVVSSSMPIRDVEWYGAVPAGVAVHCNRGANGIDGVIATAIGVALQTAAPTTLLIGDVAFLHDSSALIGLLERGIDLRIIVVDNDGGGIFSFLPQATLLAEERFEQLFGTPHGVNLSSLASAHGLAALVVDSVGALEAAAAATGPSVTIVESSRAGNVDVHAAVHEAVIAALR